MEQLPFFVNKSRQIIIFLRINLRGSEKLFKFAEFHADILQLRGVREVWGTYQCEKAFTTLSVDILKLHNFQRKSRQNFAR